MAYICNDDAVDSCFGSVRQLESSERDVFKRIVCDTDALQEKFAKWVSSQHLLRIHWQQQAEKGSSKHRKQKVRREQFNAALNKLFGK